jgi:hypothetical protein
MMHLVTGRRASIAAGMVEPDISGLIARLATVCGEGLLDSLFHSLGSVTQGPSVRNVTLDEMEAAHERLRALPPAARADLIRTTLGANSLRGTLGFV